MMKDQIGRDPKLLEKEAYIAEQTQQMNQFYNPETIYQPLDESGYVKPLDSLVTKEKAKLGTVDQI